MEELFSSFMVPLASGMNDCFATLAMTKYHTPNFYLS
jgi:hypothetical protein